MVRRRGHEPEHREHRREERDEVRGALRVRRPVPAGAEGDDQQEAEEHACARERHACLVEELHELLVPLLAELLRVHDETVLRAEPGPARPRRATLLSAAAPDRLGDPELQPLERHCDRVPPPGLVDAVLCDLRVDAPCEDAAGAEELVAGGHEDDRVPVSPLRELADRLRLALRRGRACVDADDARRRLPAEALAVRVASGAIRGDDERRCEAAAEESLRDGEPPIRAREDDDRVCFRRQGVVVVSEEERDADRVRDAEHDRADDQQPAHRGRVTPGSADMG